MSHLIITPRTKIHDLLEAYPGLEEILIAQAPQFTKLRNPVLRKTIARVTSLSQAATIGNINVVDLVNRLRKEAGQTVLSEFDSGETAYNTVKPGWFKQRKVVRTIDVRDMLHEGEQPVHEVLAAAKKLKKNEILEVIAPFLPAPLIDKASSLGCRHWIQEIAPEEMRVYFRK